jgi:Ca-activated chloride channel family protein
MSRYQSAPPRDAENSGELAFIKIRYKQPGGTTSQRIDLPVSPTDMLSDISKAPEATRFATAVAGYGSLLRGDPFIDRSFTWDSVIGLASAARGEDTFGYRSEFIQLARLAKTAASQLTLPPPGGGTGR